MRETHPKRPGKEIRAIEITVAFRVNIACRLGVRAEAYEAAAIEWLRKYKLIPGPKQVPGAALGKWARVVKIEEVP